MGAGINISCRASQMILILISACNGTKDSIEDEGVILNEAVYQLSWNDWNTTADVLNIETNLGYQVAIQKGYFSSYSLRLYPCSNNSSARFSLPISSAWAGHSDILVPGNWMNPVVEDFLIRDQVIQEKTFEEHRICKLVYTIARSDGSSENLPEDIDFQNLSLYLEGIWSKDGQEQNFIWTSTLPGEKVFSLDNCSYIQLNSDGNSMRVELERELAGAFDDVDFSVVEEQKGSLQIISNLIQQAELSCQIY